MNVLGGWARVLIIASGALAVTACASYPTEPQYSTRSGQPGRAAPAYPSQPLRAVPTEAPPPLTAPVEDIEGGALPSAGITTGLNGGLAPVRSAPIDPPAFESSRPSVATLPAGGTLAYVIQPGDTISGVGRRFKAPVQSLIDLNGLGPQGAITPGQRIVLPETAVDTGNDPYATGPAPIGVTVPNAGIAPPPPAPRAAPPTAAPTLQPMQIAPAPVRPAPAPTPGPATPVTGGIPLQWPLRGDIVRPFGPVALGERNNGINIGASAGAVVSAAAAGRVAYVGNDVAGQGLMVVIVHRDGWRTVYAQLGSATVENNADVRAGQQIGTVGLTAGDGRPSIHFETRRMQGDNPVAVDPLTVLPR